MSKLFTKGTTLVTSISPEEAFSASDAAFSGSVFCSAPSSGIRSEISPNESSGSGTGVLIALSTIEAVADPAAAAAAVLDAVSAPRDAIASAAEPTGGVIAVASRTFASGDLPAAGTSPKSIAS